jgi:hypothetical protein
MQASPRCYAVRLPNPFLGVLEIVETDRARALSRDGAHWEIQVVTERPEHTWGRDASGKASTQFFRFGDWHPDHGLSHVPLNPILDIGTMLEAGEAMAASLAELIDRLPFPFADHLEYWLLDTESRPLVLLASATDEAHIPRISVEHWHANSAEEAVFPDAVALEQLVRELAGTDTRRCWYRRHPDGSGETLSPLVADLPTGDLPRLPLQFPAPNKNSRALLDAYLDWLAPRLLPLVTLDDGERRRLERAACRQARQLESIHRLIPRILQPERINAARVEARLRGTEPAS